MVYQGASITDTQFQTSSDTLAITLLTKIIQNGSIETAQQVVNRDIQNAVDNLNMPDWGWAGAITDFLPKGLGLGQDLASVPLDKAGVMAAASGRGVARAADRLLSDGVISTANEINGIIEATGRSVFDFLNPDYDNSQTIADLSNKFDISQTIVSPIVFDLNNDGITTTGLNAGTHFDHDANGFAESTGWVNAQDGILVLDRNGNGTIDSGRELFGSETLLANGQHAANGYEALKELDTNLDGQIDNQDAAYTTLKIWKDTNGDN